MIILNIQHHLNSYIAYTKNKFSRKTHVIVNHNADNKIKLNVGHFHTYCSKRIVIKSFINKHIIKKVYKTSNISHLENKTCNINKTKLKLLLRKIGDLGYFAKVNINNYYYPRHEIIKIQLLPNEILKTIKTKKKVLFSISKYQIDFWKTI